ncbi:MAG TPA: hypothetical protein VIH86_00170 [Puia sp.]
MDQNLFNISPDALHALKCKKSLYFFLKESWNVITPSPFIDSLYIRPFCDETQRRIEMIGNDIPREDSGWIISMPPASTKSLVMNFAACWSWISFPHLRILFASHNTSKAHEDAVVRRKLITSELYQKYFSIALADDQNLKSKFSNEHNGSMSSTSVDASVLGSHYNLIIGDDIQTIQDVKSEVERNKVNEFATAFLESRTGNNPSTQIWYIMQRLHVKDVVSYLESTGNKYARLTLPAEQTSDVSPAEFNNYYVDGLLDPVRLNREVLEAKCTTLGPSNYNAQFLQAPGDDENAIIKESSFDIISPEDFATLHTSEAVNFYCDGAYTSSRKNDPTAALAGCLIKQRAYIVGLFQRWLEFPELKKELISFCYQNGYSNRSRVFIEPKASGLSLIQDFKNSDINAIASPAPKDSKEDRLIGISARVEAKKIVLVRGSWNRKFLNEVCGHSKHDDIKDALCMLVNNLVSANKGYGTYKNKIGWVGGESSSAADRINKIINWDKGQF